MKATLLALSFALPIRAQITRHRITRRERMGGTRSAS
jgi:hypothetical protein